MNCPYCETDLESSVDFNQKWDHEMSCTKCYEIIEVTHDTYTEEHSGTNVDIFELHKKGINE